MQTLRALTGWILFLVMAIVAAFFWRLSDLRGRRIEELTDQIVEIQSQISEVNQDIAQLRAVLFASEETSETQQIQGSSPQQELEDEVLEFVDPPE